MIILINWLLWLLPSIWLVWGIIAPTRQGKRARHTIWCIYRPVGPVNPDGSTTEFSHVHEKGEWRLSKLLAKLTGLAFPIVFAPPLSLVVVDPPLLLLVLLAQACVMIIVDNKTRGMDIIDYAGHGAEIIAAEMAKEIGYREAEIVRMSDDDDKQALQVREKLDQTRWLARIVFWLGRI